MIQNPPLPGQLELELPPALDQIATLRGIVGLITPAELATALNITEQTLAGWRCSQKGPNFVKLGKGVFYRLEDVQEWVKDRVTSAVTGLRPHAIRTVAMTGTKRLVREDIVSGGG